MMEIRKAAAEDLTQILAVYEYARNFMAQNGNPNQWRKGYPWPDMLQEDIDTGRLYVVTQAGEICGVFAFIPGVDPTYGYIEGRWHSDTPYAAVHRVASNGKAKGIMAACIEYCAARCSHLRMDTYKDNHIMQRALEKQGFAYCGIIYLETGSPRMAYDRVR